MFNSIYNFFSNRRLILALILLVLLVSAGYYAIQIKPIEDISKMIPVDEELERFNFANKHIKINDQIIINIYRETDSIDIRDLTAYADSLEIELQTYHSEHISEIRNTVSENTMTDAYEIFYENLPLFLEEKDYEQIEKLLKEEELEKTIEANLKTLISPSGMITKRFVKKDPLSLTPIVLKKLNNLQTEDNYEIYDNHILTKDKKNLLFFLRSNYSNDETGKNKELVKAIRTSINKLQAEFPEIKAEIFGAPVISVGNAERIKKDIILTVSIAIIALFFFLTFFYRRLEVFFVIFLPAAFGAAVSIALINFIQGEVSAISLGVGSILVGISIDYSLHIFTHFRSKSKIYHLFRDISTPILMSSLTTASAFFCLLFVSSDALQDLGLFAGISVISAALFALIALPHFLRKKKDKENNIKNEHNIIDKFTSYSFHTNKYLLFFLMIITVLSLFVFDNAEFESDMDNMNYMSEELKQAEENLNKISNDALRKMFIVSTGKDINSALIKHEKLNKTFEKLRNKEIIKSYNSVSYFIISDSLQLIRKNRWNTFWTFDKKERLVHNLKTIGSKYGFKELAFKDFFDYLNNKEFSLSSETKEKLIIIFGNEFITEDKELSSIVSIIKLEQGDKSKVYNTISEDENTFIVDKKHITDKIVQILKKDFALLVKISLSVVFIILLLYFGRIELSLITMIPMLVSWLWTLSIMWVFDIKFSIFNIIISTFIFGLGIDYSIFISRGLLQKYRFGINNLPSYKTSVLLSAVTTITAIGVLIFAQHPAMRSIAFLSIIGIISVVFVTYTLQPILFNFLVIQQGKKRSRPVVFLDLFFGLFVFGFFLAGSIFSIVILGIFKILPIKNTSKKLFFHRWLAFMSKAIAYIPLNVKKIINNPFNETFKKPAVIIANHQAHIDIPLILMLYPKILVLTNDWVQKNIFYGKIVKYADYYPTSNGFEKNLDLLKKKVKQGYSILIYPEGSRSKDQEIKRFHKGAFSYAKELNIDILPIIIQGAGDCIPSGEPFLKSGQISVNILERINPDDYGLDERLQAKNIRKYIQEKYIEIREKYETPDYFRKRLLSNYIYKTPILEHYSRIKTKIEKNYNLFNDLIPKKASIIDIGCGYGYLSNMLAYCSKEREVLGIDYDSNKINTAKNNISIPDNATFLYSDILTYKIPHCDVYILNDVLHYFPHNEQKSLIKKCLNKLNESGIIIIREGNFEQKQKHRGTKFSEVLSTKIFKFNIKKYSKLFFTSKKTILEMIPKNEFELKVIDETKFTSNIVYVIKKL